jgi:hypothetical protein
MITKISKKLIVTSFTLCVLPFMCGSLRAAAADERDDIKQTINSYAKIISKHNPATRNHGNSSRATISHELEGGWPLDCRYCGDQLKEIDQLIEKLAGKDPRAPHTFNREAYDRIRKPIITRIRANLE